MKSEEDLKSAIEEWSNFLLARVPIADLNSCLDDAIEARGSDRFPVAITEILGAWTKMHAPKIDLSKVNQCQFCEEYVTKRMTAKNEDDMLAVPQCPFHGKRKPEFNGVCGKELTCGRWPNCESFPACQENSATDARNSPEHEGKGKP